MASITMTLFNPSIDNAGYNRYQCWHRKGPVMACSGSIVFTRSSTRDKTVSFSGTISNTMAEPNGYYGFNVSAYLNTPSGNISLGNVTNKSPYGTINVSGSFQAESLGNVQLHYVCGQDGGCQKGSPDVVVGTFNLANLPYNPEVPATNITSGSVYNQNGVRNGNDKLDWNFYATWSGQTAGTHVINRYRLQLYKSGILITTIDSAGIGTRYNFETYIPKCKVRRDL